MARNYKEKRYVPIPMVRESELECDFLADAQAHNMQHQLGNFGSIRLAEYYKAKKQGRILPEGMTFPGMIAMPGAVWPAMPFPTAPAPRENPAHSRLAPEQEVSPTDLERLRNRPAVIEVPEGGADFSFFEDEDDDE
jgi:hypothetical protein